MIGLFNFPSQIAQESTADLTPLQIIHQTHNFNLSPSRAQARATLSGEFPNHAPFRYMRRVPSSTIIHVSCALSKIPYVGFSPVRLQGQVVQIRPSAELQILKSCPDIQTFTPAFS
jgi:hypothetical protein